MLDERLQRVRRELDTPPWDDLRSTRVLGRVLEEVSQTRRRRRQLAWGAGASLALGAAVVAALVSWPGQPPQQRQQARAPAAAPVVSEPAPRAPEGSVLTLADGSRAELSPNAAVHALEQSETRVAVRQSRGRVRYEVTKRPEREFVVEAADVAVRVLGTVFVVELMAEGVEVTVERGRVAVADASRRVELTRGESVFLAKGDPAPQADNTAPSEPRSAPAQEKSQRRARGEPAPSVAALLARADEARQRGKLPQAAQALSLLVKHHAQDPRAISAWFTLGRVERARGRYAASARAFDRCFQRDSAGTLAEDALAESARAWSSAGHDEQARSAAERYLARYPGGAHAGHMAELSKR